MDSSLLNGSSFSNDSQFLGCDKDSIFSKLGIFINATCTILGLPVTLIVLIELHKRSHDKATSELFMINLTITDLAYVVVIPLKITDYMEWGYMEFQCVNSVTDAFTLCTRPLFMACICVDFYFAVVHPITYRTSKKSSIIRKVMSLIVWVSTFCFSSYNCFQMRSIPFTSYSTPLLMALPIIVFCDISILQALRKPAPTGKNNVHPLKRRALHTIFNSLVVTLITYLPPVVIFLCANIIPLKREDYYCKVFMFAFWFSMSGTCIMQVLYLDTVGKLDCLKNMLKKYIWN